MTEVMPAAMPEKIGSVEKTGWDEVGQVEFLGRREAGVAERGESRAAEALANEAGTVDEVNEARRAAEFDEWQRAKTEREKADEEREKLAELKKRAGRDIAVDAIRNPGKYEKIQSEAEEEIQKIREEKKEELISKGMSEMEARKGAREYDGRTSFFMTAREALAWGPGKVGAQAVDAIYPAEIGYQSKHAKKERLGAETLEGMNGDTPVEIRVWVDQKFMGAETKRRQAIRKMSIAKRYEAVAEKMWPGDLAEVKAEAEWKEQQAKEWGEGWGGQEDEQILKKTPEKETAEEAVARLSKRLAKEERMLKKDKETLDITLAGKMNAENKRRKVWNEERVKSDEKIIEDLKFQMTKIEETGDPVAAERALLMRWQEQEKAQILELSEQVKKMRFWQGAKKRELRGKIAELQKRQKEYWPVRVAGRSEISHNI